MAKYAWWADVLTGGGAGALDAIDGSLLNDGDLAVVHTNTYFYIYYYDSDSVETEASPQFIVPDDNATGAWILKRQLGAYEDVGKSPNGFPNRTDTTLAFDNGTRTFTLGDAGSGYSIMHGARLFGYSGNKTVVIDDVNQTNWITINSAGTLAASSDYAFDSGDALVATVAWDGTTGILGEERHSFVMDNKTHEVLHDGFGPLYESGFALTFLDDTFTIGAGEFHDEDLEHEHAQQTTCRVLYRLTVGSPSTWTWGSAVTKYYNEDGSSNVLYDNAGTPTAVPANQYSCMWIYASNDVDTPIYSVMGQRTDTTIAAARLNNVPESLDLTGLPSAEMILLARVILRNDATPYEETEDYRGSFVTGRTSVVYGAGSTASNITTDTTNFNEILSGTDTDAQTALETLDDHLHQAQTLTNDGITPNSGTLLVTGNMGVGGAPTYKFDVIGNVAGSTYAAITNSNSAGICGIYSVADAGGVIIQAIGSTEGATGWAGYGRVRSDSGMNGLFIGTGGAKPLIFGTNDTTRLTIDSVGITTLTSSATNSPYLKMVNTNADATGGYLYLKKDSSSPADDDVLGTILGVTDTSTGAESGVGSVIFSVEDVTNGIEAGRIDMRTKMNGTWRSMIDISGYNGTANQGTMTFNSAQQDVDFSWHTSIYGETMTLDGFTGQLRVLSGVVQAGVDVTRPGTVACFGSATGSSTGGKMQFYTAFDYTSPVSVYQCRAYNGNFEFGSTTYPAMVRLNAHSSIVINEDGADIDTRIEASTDANAFFVQGSDGYIGMGTASPGSELHLKSSVTLRPIVTLENTNADNATCALHFKKLSASPATNDNLAAVKGIGYNSALTEYTYSGHYMLATNVASGDESGSHYFNALMNGTDRNLLVLNGYSGSVNHGLIAFNPGKQDVDFRVSATSDTNALFIDGGTGYTGIGFATPTVPLHVTGTVTAYTPTVIIQNDASDVTPAVLGFVKETASPADDDLIGAITGTSQNSAAEDFVYTYQYAYIADATDGDEAGGHQFYVAMNGTQRNLLNITGYYTGVDQGLVQINAAAQDVDFRVNASGLSNRLVVRGSDGMVGFGTYTTLGSETIQGYITIMDNGGTSRKLAVIA